MAYLEIADFRAGMNRQRRRIAGAAGTLWLGENVLISRGGDIERAKKFVPTFTLPEGTYGLTSISGQLYVFGSADLAASMPAGVVYKRLQAPNTPNMVSILWAGGVDGVPYAIAEYDDGEIHHFLDTTRVSEWDAIAAGNSSFDTLADYLARKIDQSESVAAAASGNVITLQARTPGTAFTVSAATVDGGGTNDQTATVTTVQANVAAVAEVQASGTITVTGGSADPGTNQITAATVNGVALMSAAVDWTGSNASTALLLATEINNNSGTHGYLATATDATVTLTAAPGTGATPNGHAITVTTAGNATATTSTTISGGVTAVAPVRQISRVTFGGTYEALDTFTVTVDGTAYRSTGRASGHGTYGFLYKKRLYFVANSLVVYTQINDFDDLTDASAASGAGQINISNDSEGAERLLSLQQYQEYVAIFSRRSIRIYNFQTDAQLNAIVQPLSNTGTYAPRSTLAFGNTDTMYLADTGIRSLQIRDLANAAFVNDVGSAIDTFIQDYVRTLPAPTAAAAVAALEPESDRYFLAVGERIFVLSYFPSPKVAAWTYLSPGFTVESFATANGVLYARDATKIYAYGGTSGDTYPDADELVARVQLPFISARKPSTWKSWTGIDIGCSNTWRVEMLVDPADETKKVDLGRPSGPTFAQMDLRGVGHTPMIALDLTCDSAGEATISNIVLHFESTEAR